MSKLKGLIRTQNHLKDKIVEAHQENIGKYYLSEHFLSGITAYYITGVESLKSYIGTTVKVGPMTGIAVKDFIPTYIILEHAKEIDKKEFDTIYNKVITLLQQ